MTPTVVTIIMAAVTTLIIGLDVYLALDGTSGNTYSERLRAWGKAWPPTRAIVVFGFGLLAGHWWW